MKKLLFGFCALALAISCQKKVANEPEAIADEPTSVARHCAAEEVLQQQIAADPRRAERLREIEAFTKNAIETGRLVNGVIEIPVVVNVLYRTTAENISDAQIASQITVLNEDFNNTNADGTKTPAEWSSLRANYGIRFVLAKTVRKATNKRSWGTNDDMKRSSRGGIDPTLPTTHLNMWACNLGQGLLGYAQFPGGPAATDGVVVLYSAFGSRAKAAGTYVANYDLGRTATHEVGHWLNLRHIWGDATCGNDLVGDTPYAQTSNGGCPAYPKVSACTTGGTHNEMTMNYMDYTYDRCMYMFTTGQKDRSLALFAAGGARNSFAQP
ncbi:zinc metalloprotease [Flaviaesturariibacter amylovorans]|uniref:Zinc metalloprotease n=1 Tax=Flaviaesturariibacter amylovorans TaxID=1084520 RepID=A0ABP8GAK1_9BACT